MYVVDITYAAVQLSMFISTMIDSASCAFEEKIDCECDEKNIETMQLEEVVHKHKECLSYFHTK